MIYLNVFDWFFHQPLKNYEVLTTQPVTREKKLKVWDIFSPDDSIHIYGRQQCSSCRKLVILFVVITAAVIVLWLGALFLLFVLLYFQRVASHSCETLRELLHRPHIRADLRSCFDTSQPDYSQVQILKVPNSSDG